MLVVADAVASKRSDEVDDVAYKLSVMAKTTSKKPVAAKAKALTGPLAKLVKRARAADRYDAGEAMSAILALGKKAAPVQEIMRELLNDTEPRRGLTARAVLAVLDEDRVAHLDALMIAAAGSGDTKAVARVNLGDLPAELAAVAIQRALGAAKPKLRATALLMASGTVASRKAIPVGALVPLLDDADAAVREMAIHAVQMHVDPDSAAPAKATAKLTPAIRSKVERLQKDASPKVAGRALRFLEAFR
ncbi:hypothetical protein BH09MYX1_BH09MYX1_58100 [soil metagenome]